MLLARLIGLSLLVTVQTVPALDIGESCVTPKDEPGKYILFRECASLVALYLKPNLLPSEREFVMNSKCGQLNRKALLCCANPDTIESPTTPSSADAGEKALLLESPNCDIHNANRLYGGPITQVDEFPWTVLLEYHEGDSVFGYHCGIPRPWKLYRVRLGEWDLSENKYRDEDYYTDPPIDLGIEKTITHSDYELGEPNKNNDIALIRLNRTVHFSDTVQPICLPSTSLRNHTHVDYIASVAGWGKTETTSASERKLRMTQRVTTLEECNTIYKFVIRTGVSLKQTHLCAGRINLRDTCCADSGGPLMRSFSGISGTWSLVGVDNFGAEKCGSSKMPRVYTNVNKLIDWIGENR
uniref:CLIP domain-containing serine protease n=1 Tax=Anopheles dirus TaxID=7168 RepID=A0A182N5C2_9DIPT